MTTPGSRAATAAAVGALTEFLAERDTGTARGLRDYLSQLIDDDGAGALAQGYFGLLNLAALLLPGAAAAAGVTPDELLRSIGLQLARDLGEPGPSGSPFLGPV